MRINWGGGGVDIFFYVPPVMPFMYISGSSIWLFIHIYNVMTFVKIIANV